MATWSHEQKIGGGGVVTLTQGSPIGLLLALTYSSTQTIGSNTTWTNQVKNRATYSHTIKHVETFTHKAKS